MWFKHRAWIPIAWLLSLINVGATWFAAAPAEAWHATAHAALAVLFGVGAQRLTDRRRSRSPSGEIVIGDERLRHLEASIDAIAIEMERIGEGQRFVTKLLGEPGRELELPTSRRDPVPARPATHNEDT
ncbi:MAG TPA: hypothetical protein VJ650_02770 [Gemmatimonadaceae bacterium]|nr:hypothetical protein [Gemmatimonadaceae bacterium]